MANSPHRQGRPYRTARRLMFAAFGDTCHICGHPGAGEADHLIPVALAPGQPVDYRNLRPSHGSNSPCFACPRGPTGRPRCCNQSKGANLAAPPVFVPLRRW